MSKPVGTPNKRIRPERELFVALVTALLQWNPALSNAALATITGRHPTEVSRLASTVRARLNIPAAKKKSARETALELAAELSATLQRLQALLEE